MIKILSRVLWILRARPEGVTCPQLCRILNGVTVEACYNCCDYGNAWKRRRGILKTPACRIRKGSVWYALRQLLKRRLAWSRREKRPDPYMVRGWDLMNVYRVGFEPTTTERILKWC